MKKIVFIILIVFNTLYANSYLFNDNEVESFNSVTFSITKGTAHYKGLGGGTYELYNTYIEPLQEPNSYIAHLEFARKKRIMSYKHKEDLGVMFDGDKLWIKYNNKIYQFLLPYSKSQKDSRFHTISTKKYPRILDIKIEHMELKFEF